MTASGMRREVRTSLLSTPLRAHMAAELTRTGSPCGNHRRSGVALDYRYSGDEEFSERIEFGWKNRTKRSEVGRGCKPLPGIHTDLGGARRLPGECQGCLTWRRSVKHRTTFEHTRGASASMSYPSISPGRIGSSGNRWSSGSRASAANRN